MSEVVDILVADRSYNEVPKLVSRNDGIQCSRPTSSDVLHHSERYIVNEGSRSQVFDPMAKLSQETVPPASIHDGIECSYI
jgi:hypothetical protein